MDALEIVNSVGIVLIGIALLVAFRRQRWVQQASLQMEKVDMDSFEIFRLAIGNVIGRLTCRSSEEMVQIVDQELDCAAQQLARNTEELREEPSKPQEIIDLRADKDDKVAVQVIQAVRDIYLEQGAKLLVEREASCYHIKMRIQ